MLTFLKEGASFLKKEEWLLLGGSLVLSAALLFLGLNHVLPFGLVDFVFFSAVVFLASLFRPAWMFLLLIALVPLETTMLAPPELGFGLHPYQWWAVLLFLALLCRTLGKRMPFPPFSFSRLDFFILLIPLGALVSAFVNASPSATRLSVIVVSYFLLYVLGRIFFRKIGDLSVAFPFFLVGTLLTSFFGLFQNIFFLSGEPSFATMPGRPNGTFSEADWLGMFLLLVTAALFAFLWRLHQVNEKMETPFSWKGLFSSALLLFIFILLILTVSRSAWLGGTALLSFFVVLVLFGRPGEWKLLQWKNGIFFGNVLVVLLALAIFIVQDLSLTRFELLNRAQSTGSGLQEITISCTSERALPKSIGSLEELVPLGCHFINLEEIVGQKAEGNFVTRIYRPDPNVGIRRGIYATALEALRNDPLFGIGWGAIGDRLGRDARGAALNASNVYLEVWLGAGLIGLIGLLGWMAMSFFLAWKKYFLSPNREERTFALFFLLGLLGMGIFNLFNSGILLGFVWLFFALAPLLDDSKTDL